MTVPRLSLSPQPATDLTADVLVVGVTSSTHGPVVVGLDGVDAVAGLGDQLAAIGFTGGRDDVRRIPSSIPSVGSITVVGLGADAAGPESLRYAAGTASRSIRGVDAVVVALPTATADDVQAVIEGLAIAAYSYDDYRSAVKAEKRVPTEFVVATAVPVDDAIVERAVAIADATHVVRDLVNMPPADLYPESFANRAVELADGLPLTVTVLDEQGLADGGFGGILGVGQGSSRGPRLVKVEYSPADAPAHIAIVGKGITFDTGGLSLKPPASMVGMKYDMTGAATALGVVVAAARTALPVRMTAWLCLAENMPSGTAIRPNDVLTIRGGTTVEVLNTDAEGRLVLADGIVAASEEHPDAIIDVATLTGAAVVAMGNRYTAVMGDAQLVSRVVAAGDRTGEPMWAMPLPRELRALLDSDVADIANVKIGNTAGGMLIAGVFLSQFVGRSGDDESPRIPWAHLDIAGPANNAAGGYGFTGKGPTGVAVRALFELADEFSRG
ncbi:leucyl aminopeptidase [Marisediminicola senii]|uniref:leucyl aminopeptidase n=1 Tax=Marisediminicola senii TaxID=2711233 RepID=UPI0013EDA9BC|nr:leucyl aminopeptidase [Marisediminicola senii]